MYLNVVVRLILLEMFCILFFWFFDGIVGDDESCLFNVVLRYLIICFYLFFYVEKEIKVYFLFKLFLVMMLL